MSGSLNKVTLIGNLGKNPDIRSTRDGRKVASFSLATSTSWKDKTTGEKKENTQWHNIVIFNEGLVSIVEKFVSKGSKIYVEGQLQTRKWQNKEGVDNYITEVVLQGFTGTIILLTSKESRGGSNDYAPHDDDDHEYNQRPPSSNSNLPEDELDDEIPF